MSNLPATVQDLVAQRRSLRSRTLHDDVEAIFLKLWDDPTFRRWFDAIHPSQTVEGSFQVDDVLAAEQVREYAIANHFPVAASAKLAALIFSIHTVQRRYHISRAERRNRVGGETVKPTKSREDLEDAA